MVKVIGAKTCSQSKKQPRWAASNHNSDGSPLSGLSIHFDVYDYAKSGHGEFAPFSHDADVYVIHEPDGGVIAIPEPTTLVTLGGLFGTLGLGWVVRRRRGSSGG